MPSTRHQNCLNKSLPSEAAGPKPVLVSIISSFLEVVDLKYLNLLNCFLVDCHINILEGYMLLDLWFKVFCCCLSYPNRTQTHKN